MDIFYDDLISDDLEDQIFEEAIKETILKLKNMEKEKEVFRVGDQVRLIGNLVVGEYYGEKQVLQLMACMCFKGTGTIVEVDNEDDSALLVIPDHTSTFWYPFSIITKAHL